MDEGLNGSESAIYSEKPDLTEKPPVEMGEPAIRSMETYVLKDQKGAFVILGPGGNIHDENRVEGLYRHDMRYGSRLKILCNRQEMDPVSAEIADDNSEFMARLVNPMMKDNVGNTVPENTLHFQRRISLNDNVLRQTLKIENYHTEPVVLSLIIDADADFVDMFKIREASIKEPQALGKRGALVREFNDAAETWQVKFAYHGKDSIDREGTLRYAHRPDHMEGSTAHFEVTLQPGQSWRTQFSLGADKQPEAPSIETYEASLAHLRRARADLMGKGATITFGNPTPQKFLDKSRHDIAMLLNDEETGPYPCAGVPWFATNFGRDALITALQMLTIEPGLAKGVLKFLAKTQATETDAARDADPGKILHEFRQCEMANLGEVPFGRYYGGVDQTLLFIVLAEAYHRRTGDVETIREIMPNIKAALGWTAAQQGEDGTFGYSRKAETGLENQFWKDSKDSVFYENGDINVLFPRRVCEVQGYAYAAWEAGQALALATGDAETASAYQANAERIKTTFNTKFWMVDRDAYALALDGEGRQCKVLGSNMGQLLFSGIVPQHRVGKIVDRLMSSDFFTGFGIRTIAKGEARYNPLSYHDGSVWPHDVGMTMRGFKANGFFEEAMTLAKGLMSVAEARHWRLPELFSGHTRVPGFGPTDYPKACSPQAWAAAVAFQSVDTALGLEVDALNHIVRINPVAMPKDWGPVTIDNLRTNGGRISFVVEPAAEGRWTARITGQEGHPATLINACAPQQLAPQSSQKASGSFGRAAAACARSVRSFLGGKPTTHTERGPAPPSA
jgi:glycogen debranching enzyme